MQNFLIVGFGKVGSSLYRAMATLNRFNILLLDAKKDFKEEWASFLPAHSFFRNIVNIRQKSFEFIAICTPDDRINETVSQLQDFQLKNCAVFHTSGNKPAELLNPLRDRGAHIGSLHPLQTFNSMFLPPEVWQGITCTFQGDTKLKDNLQKIFDPLKTKIVPIDYQQKQLLHLVATISANFQVALYSWAEQILKASGIEPPDLNTWLGPLIRQVSTNLNQHPLSKILSGPLQRGDLNTLEDHLKLLKKYQKAADIELYRLLCQKLLENLEFEIKDRQKLKNFLEHYET
ncbi:MAG: DUF2520 domain-containing protein [Caldisericaceae bacterium]|nr:DUF2520 domain-containing protein [Caldisericaceae bacterium]